MGLIFLISKLLVNFVEILNFPHNLDFSLYKVHCHEFLSWKFSTFIIVLNFVSFFRSFLCLSLRESDRNEPKNEKESQPFLPRKGAKRGFEYSQWTIWTSANAYLRHPARITFRLERSLSPRLTHVRRGVWWMRSLQNPHCGCD